MSAPMKRPPFTAARLNNAPAVYKPLLKQLYAKLNTTPDAQVEGISLLVDFMYQMTDADDLAVFFTKDEIHHIHELMYQVCLATVLEDFKAPKVDPDARFMLQQFHHAFNLMGAPEDVDPYEYLIAYGLLCLDIDLHHEARDAFREALTLQPDNAFAQSALDYATDCMSLPRFRMGYVSRSMNTWEAFSRLIANYRKGNINTDDFRALTHKIFAVWTGLETVAMPNPSKKGTGSVEFSPTNWQMDFYPISAVLSTQQDVSSKELLKSWDAYLGFCNYRGEVRLEDGSSIPLHTVQTVLEDTPDRDGVHVKLYHPSIQGQLVSTLTDLLSAEVASTLKASDYCILIRSVEVLAQKPARFTGTIETIPEQLKAMGYTLNLPIEDVAPRRMRRTYTRKPKRGPGKRLRDDILQGDTLCWSLQEEYECNETAAADYYTNRGIAPVFLAWPRSIMHCSDEQYTQQLLDSLGKNEFTWNMQVLGRASGTEYCYLDLLLWNTGAMIGDLSAFLAMIPGGNAFRIQSFYPDAYPCPVSRDYIMAHSSIQHLDEAFPSIQAEPWTGPQASPPKHTAPPPKAKKKNAAKAKRKHSKKFH